MANDDKDNELPIAITALVIAIAALFAATLQILQAIFASARGLPNCNDVVMGGWSKGTKIRPKITQLRLEVKFEAPVIFLAPPRNSGKPEPTGDMWFAEGTEMSCRKNRLDWVKLFKDSDSKATEKVHTVDMELATWVYLLIAIEKMEKDSKFWELKKLQKEGFPGIVSSDLPEPTLAVKIQAKERSFDTIPAMKKPFATSTISHLIELAAILGIYWKVFDRDNNQYRAEGNGYSLTGSRIADLGIQFVFEKTGHTSFEARRVIPTSEVKELCFGRVPTLFRKKMNLDEDVDWQKELKTSSGTGVKVEILQMGSVEEIAETLTQIGCNGNTTLYYTEKKKHRHLFPVTFEVLGMLARVLHIEGRCFRFLPNPTIFPWDKESFSLPRLLDAFSRLIMDDLIMIDEEIEAIPDDSLEEVTLSVVKDIRALSKSAEALYKTFENDSKLTCDRMTALHKAIVSADRVLKIKEQEIVLDVLRRHLQEVLAAINNPASGGEGKVSFSHLLDIPLEMRESRFMETYFKSILWRVVGSAKDSKRDDEIVSQAIHEDTEKRLSRHGNERLNSINAPLESTPETSIMDGSQTESIPTPGISKRGSWPHRNETEHHDRSELPKMITIAEQPGWATTLTKHVEMQRVAVWYTLVFRMICWLLLHDFDKKDVQLSKSELIGNRQTVFIL
ncbi:modin [Colletotrichum incanum]|uniref:Modin n=1 Tax=Colletotrichum incanum TaxID=1573173 RepID=A0A166LN39_COLIC|nr:modin [Colletotrichum incanum]OHW97938.1 modin [Colletotrichum incanum]